MKATAISVAISVALVFVVLVIVEMLRKRGSDPVGRVADAILPLSTTPPASAA